MLPLCAMHIVHSLPAPGKTPSPCTQSRYAASNNLTFDCFEQLALRCTFLFCYHSMLVLYCYNLMEGSICLLF